MTTEKLKNYEPLFGSWTVESKIGETSRSKLFKVTAKKNGKTYICCAEAIKFPTSDEELSKIIASGKYTNINQYLDHAEASLREEAQKMIALNKETNVVGYYDYTIIKESSCFYFVILKELLRPLSSQLKNDESVTVNTALKIGCDICAALDCFRNVGIVHHKVRPENIFVSQNGTYKLGDFGFFDENTTENDSLSAYVAPELYNRFTVDTSSDIYALGILLYKLLNDNRLPFLPAKPAPINYIDLETAHARRIRGDMFPEPKHADYALAKIIYNATAFNTANRYSFPLMFLNDLEAQAKALNIPKAAPVTVDQPPVRPQPERPTHRPIPNDRDILFNRHERDYGDDFEDEKDEFEDAFDDEDYYEEEGETVSKKWYIIIALLVIVLGVAIAFFSLGGFELLKKESTTTQPSTWGTTESTATTETTTTETTTTQTTTDASASISASVSESLSISESISVSESLSVSESVSVSLSLQNQSSTSSEPSSETSDTTQESTIPVLTTSTPEGTTDINGRLYVSLGNHMITRSPAQLADKDFVIVFDKIPLGENLTANSEQMIVYQIPRDGTQAKKYFPQASIAQDSNGNTSLSIKITDENFIYRTSLFDYHLVLETGSITTASQSSKPIQIVL